MPELVFTLSALIAAALLGGCIGFVFFQLHPPHQNR